MLSLFSSREHVAMFLVTIIHEFSQQFLRNAPWYFRIVKSNPLKLSESAWPLQLYDSLMTLHLKWQSNHSLLFSIALLRWHTRDFSGLVRLASICWRRTKRTRGRKSPLRERSEKAESQAVVRWAELREVICGFNDRTGFLQISIDQEVDLIAGEAHCVWYSH